MAECKTIARVLLRPDGNVHIVFRGVRAVYATASNLKALFSDPIEFIEKGSYTCKESTIEINRKRVELEEVLGLTLASVNSDKQIICDFPELFHYLFAAKIEKGKKEGALNMKAFELETVLSDEKSFLLRHYLEFTNYFKSTPAIKTNIKLREEVQSAILREIISMFFEDDLPKASKAISVEETFEQIEMDNLLSTAPPEIDKDMLTCAEYAKFIDVTPQTVLNYIHNKRLKSAKKNEHGKWLIHKDDRPIDWNLRNGRKHKKKFDGENYRRKSTGSAADVEEHILKMRLFTAAVAPYIHTFEELDYYIKRSYHEVEFDGKPALIVDINPDYRSSITGLTNRELMRAGKAPVVPNRDKEEYVFHLHHIGQHTTSPLATIPEYDHNSSEFSSYFHQGKPNAELHDASFEAEKKNFWRTFLEEYDKAIEFRLIPYKNPKYRGGVR